MENRRNKRDIANSRYNYYVNHYAHFTCYIWQETYMVYPAYISIGKKSVRYRALYNLAVAP